MTSPEPDALATVPGSAPTVPGSAPTVPGSAPSGRALRAGIAGGLAYGMIGWRSMLVPALIRSIEPGYGQTDAGMGTYFLATSLGYRRARSWAARSSGASGRG